MLIKTTLLIWRYENILQYVNKNTAQPGFCLDVPGKSPTVPAFGAQAPKQKGMSKEVLVHCSIQITQFG